MSYCHVLVLHTSASVFNQLKTFVVSLWIEREIDVSYLINIYHNYILEVIYVLVPTYINGRITNRTKCTSLILARKPYTCVKEKSIIMHANDKIFNFDLHRTDESYLLAVVNLLRHTIFRQNVFYKFGGKMILRHI